MEFGGKIILKFKSPEQMIIVTAIFAKMINNQEANVFNQIRIDEDSHRLIGVLGLNDALILKMYKQIYKTLNDPVRIYT